MTDEELLTEIYSAFEPFQPPPKEVYVAFEEVRGKWDVIQELGRKITRSKNPTCQLYSGHRGVGKSTELLRLKEYLEQQRFFVVYFAADEQDIEPQDADYAEILFACTRHLVEAIKIQNHNPLVDWMRERWASLKDLALTELAFEGLDLETQILQFAKITATLKAVPDKRRELRQRINANTPSLIQALNDFIAEAQKQLPAERNRGLVVIVDNLDRIVEVREPGKPSNYEEIYLNRCDMLRGLNCHTIYTVPIALVYSERATDLEINYDKPDVLPMIMVRHPNGGVNAVGLGKLREMVARRIQGIDPALVHRLDSPMEGKTSVFDSAKTLEQLFLMSGGHVRNLMQLIQKAIDYTDVLPIKAQAVKRAVEEARETYKNAIQEPHWEILASACHYKEVKNNEQCLRLLLSRCLLEYRYYDEDGNLKIWHNVHPLVEDLKSFQEALAKVRGQ
ncbi:MAG: ATP-binding protein [Thermosynechococcaceae cyanobacterium]